MTIFDFGIDELLLSEQTPQQQLLELKLKIIEIATEFITIVWRAVQCLATNLVLFQNDLKPSKESLLLIQPHSIVVRPS